MLLDHPELYLVASFPASFKLEGLGTRLNNGYTSRASVHLCTSECFALAGSTDAFMQGFVAREKGAPSEFVLLP